VKTLRSIPCTAKKRKGKKVFMERKNEVTTMEENIALYNTIASILVWGFELSNELKLAS
jgi:hypothetical protein